MDNNFNNQYTQNNMNNGYGYRQPFNNTIYNSQPYTNPTYNQGYANYGYNPNPYYNPNAGGYSYYQNLYNMFGGYNPIVDKDFSTIGKLGLVAGGSLLAVFVMQIVVSTVIGVLLQVFGVNTDDTTLLLVVNSIGQAFYMLLPFAIIGLLNKPERKGLVSVFGAPKSGMLCIIGVFAGLMVTQLGNFATSYFSVVLEMAGVSFGSGTEDIVFQTDFISTLISILTTAAMPALFEEFAFRGVLMQPLRKYGDWFAIIMSSFCFAVVHGNMVQIPFAFIAGISMGYFCIKTKSIWTSVAIHFLNNLLSVLFTVYYTVYPDASMLLYYVVEGALLIIGTVAFIVFKKNCSIKLKKDATSMSKHKGLKSAAFIATPPMTIAIAFALLSSITFTELTPGGWFIIIGGLFFVGFYFVRAFLRIKKEKRVKFKGMYTASMIIALFSCAFLAIAALLSVAV